LIAPNLDSKSLYSYDQNHWCPTHLIVNAGSIISSIEYNNAKDGNATTTKTRDGITVQTISINVPCTTLDAIPVVEALVLK
jgi:hypothetical protein